MKTAPYREFDALRKEFSELVERLDASSPWLRSLQDELRLSLGYDDYRIETPIVYNRALDDVTKDNSPRYIIVADNPGKNEQKSANCRYLVGQSGKLAQGWFERELKTDFRQAAIIINKTPLHTPKTAELKLLKKLAVARSPGIAATLDELLAESQIAMANLAFRLHRCLGGVLWVSGYGELGPRGLFSVWAKEITKLYARAPASLVESVWVFRHFSMNQFAIEYRAESEAAAGYGLESSPEARLAAIGTANRRRILGW